MSGLTSEAFADFRYERDGSPSEGKQRAGARSLGWWAMVWLCVTEGMLFACFLASYFFLRGSVQAFGAEGGRDIPLGRPLMMTALLLLSSIAVWWGEHGIRKGKPETLRLGFLLAFLLGVGFLAIQGNEYANREQSWTTSAYDSLFITITACHGFHVLVGLLMNVFVQVRAGLNHFRSDSHEAVSNSALYWHFVGGVWLAILLVLYVSPRMF